MGKYRVNVLQIAQDDMKSIVSYIRVDNPDAAVRMVEKIREAIGNLSEYPLRGAIPRDKRIAEQGYRMVIVEPYLIFYIVITEESVVEVHRVLHGKQEHLRII